MKIIDDTIKSRGHSRKIRRTKRGIVFDIRNSQCKMTTIVIPLEIWVFWVGKYGSESAAYDELVAMRNDKTEKGDYKVNNLTLVYEMMCELTNYNYYIDAADIIKDEIY